MLPPLENGNTGLQRQTSTGSSLSIQNSEQPLRGQARRETHVDGGRFQSKLKSADWWENRAHMPAIKSELASVADGLKDITGARQIMTKTSTGTRQWRKAATPVKRSKSERPDPAFVAHAGTIRAQLAQRRWEQRWFLLPGQSLFLDRWDAVGVFMIMYTALFTPFEVAFLDSFKDITAWTHPRFLVNRLVDAYFLSDLVIQFFIAVRKPENVPSNKYRLIGDTHIRDRGYIAWRYFVSGWVRPSGGSDSIWRARPVSPHATRMSVRHTRATACLRRCDTLPHDLRYLADV
jgi:hypothetical protein